MYQDDRALFLLNKYGDDLYRFAFILTCSDEAAGQILPDVFEEAAGKQIFTDKDKDDKLILLSLIYKNAAKRGGGGGYDEKKHGKKSGDFMQMIKLPQNERAVSHLMLYEDLTEQEAKAVTGSK